MWIIPVSKERRTSRPAFMLWTFIAVCVFAYVISLTRGLDDTLYDWGYRPGAPAIGAFFASLILHAGFFHLFGNMLFLWCFGEAVDDALGTFSLLLILLVTHTFALLAHTITHSHDTTPVIGASGAVSGVMGIYAFLYSQRKITLHVFIGIFRMGKFDVNALVAILSWLGFQLVMAIISHGRGTGVAYWAHIGGIGIGFILGFLYKGLGYPKKELKL